MEKQTIVVLTGAGISAESGIRTFRASDGLWENHRIEDVATPGGFSRNPELVHQFYNARRAHLFSEDVSPNAAHDALVALERFCRQHQHDFLLVTQNVDNLHERAGSKALVHMHGALLSIRCQQTGRVFSHADDLTTDTLCACCHVAGQLRPDIVWFDEMPMHMARIEAALAQCTVFVSIGTSGHVYPAAGFVQLANHAGAQTVEINLEPSSTQNHFETGHYGLASVEVPAFVSALTARLATKNTN